VIGVLTEPATPWAWRTYRGCVDHRSALLGYSYGRSVQVSQQTSARWAHRGAWRFGGGHLLCSLRARRDHEVFVVVVPGKTLVLW